MNPSVLEKLDTLQQRFEALGIEMSDPKVMNDQNAYKALTKEYSQLTPLIKEYEQFCALTTELASAVELSEQADGDMKAMADEEVATLKDQLEQSEQALRVHLLPRDPNDDSNVFLEIRAGTGGDEAAIFAGDLFKMYARFAELKGFQVEIIHSSEGDHGGYKEMVSRIMGNGAYALLKFESGAHRVQRVPDTETQGRIHTSACTVAVLPERDEVDDININPSDLRIDTFRASGAGGQHVNKTDSAVRITHIPTGTVVECQDGRSQHKNKAQALSLLKARIQDAEQEKLDKERAAERKSLVGSGDRSERIRTYNYPQSRVTDHRINLTLYKLDEIMQGSLDVVIEPLTQAHQADAMASIE